MPSQTAEHALRAIVYLASLPTEEPVPAERVADALGAPANYLSKTLHVLACRGLLRSTPGRRGGFSLARPPEHIALSAILDVFDEPSDAPICLLEERPCDRNDPCMVHSGWECVRRARRLPLARTTVADLLYGPGMTRHESGGDELPDTDPFWRGCSAT